MSNELVYGVYILVWLVLIFGVLVVICGVVVWDVCKVCDLDEDFI